MADMALANQSADLVMSSLPFIGHRQALSQSLGACQNQRSAAFGDSGGRLFLKSEKRFPELPVFDFLPSHAWLAAIQTLRQQRQGTLIYHTEQSFAFSYDNLKVC